MNLWKKSQRKKVRKMTEIVLASNNKKKIIEMRDLLKAAGEVNVLSLQAINFNDEIVEDGTSFEENSLIKASTPAKLGYIGVADDSGLAVDYLGGAPGIFSARYSGEGATDESNREKLFKELEGVPTEDRTARFVCAASLVLPENCPFRVPEKWRISEELSKKTGIPADRAMVVRGEVHGYILEEERGEGGFGYDCMFWYPDFGCTLAEVTPEQKASVSHRGKAMREFTARFVEMLK